MKRNEFTRFFKTVNFDRKNRAIEKMDVRLVAKDFEGTLHATDLQLQEGRKPTGYMPASREFYKYERNEVGEQVKVRHFNGILRRDKTIVIPNRARLDIMSDDKEQLLDRVTCGLDLTFNITQDMKPGALEFAYLNGTRAYNINERLNNGDEYKHHASTRKTTKNGRFVSGYYGPYQIIPRGFGRYDTKVNGSTYLLAEVEQRVYNKGGRRM